MNDYEYFHHLLKRDFSPLLRAEGFKGSGTTFRRIKNEIIHVVNIQGSRYGGQCCVNLCVHLSFLPIPGMDLLIDPKKVKEYECRFRSRLHEPGEDEHWWSYGTTEAEAEAGLANLIATYRRCAALFFNKFEPFPEVFERITPAEIDARDFSRLPAWPWGGLELTLALIMKHLGHFEKCRQFAEVGLRHLGCAVGLEPELKRLRNAGL